MTLVITKAGIDVAVRPAPPGQRPRWTAQRVEAVRRWKPSLFTLRVARPAGFGFTPGHYARLGLPVAGGETAWRPYSLVSAPDDPGLEFLVTVVPGGALSGRLAGLVAGDELLVESAAMGFFLERELAPGETLWMLATGAGVGPYVSMLRAGAIAGGYRKIVLVHSVRTEDELAYAEELRAAASSRSARVRYLQVVTRGDGASALHERIPALLANGALEAAADARLDPDGSRVMVCGNPGFTAEMRGLLTRRGFRPCRRAAPGTMLFENYWQ